MVLTCLAGHNTIEPMLNGCVLHEHYTTPSGYEGESMVLAGSTQDAEGAITLQRITWSRVNSDPDRVRQLWEASTDGGETWTVAFDGLYARVEGTRP